MAPKKEIYVSKYMATKSFGITGVNVQVGEGDKQKTFLLHQDLKESDDKEMKLPEDDPEIFALYVQLLYTGQVPTKQKPVTHLTVKSEFDASDTDDASDRQLSTFFNLPR
ncbi:hypothetical protein BCR34DRAFT_604329 [Clohesyomyces aquaticus]|uniref:BTB domain-containing protein n=1 Tax=Clohesyomyces aquaticus TaxID=1231657 RepID=A0A1Y1Z6W1_9PLEO|nr:hypothetical protein BCR34DRAFT_604329 [Clohesyomyces aquaticus]